MEFNCLFSLALVLLNFALSTAMPTSYVPSSETTYTRVPSQLGPCNSSTPILPDLTDAVLDSWIEEYKQEELNGSRTIQNVSLSRYLTHDKSDHGWITNKCAKAKSSLVDTSVVSS